MRTMQSLPLIGLPACLITDENRTFHRVVDKYITAVHEGAGGIPVLLPALGPRIDAGAMLERLDGLMLTGARSNIEPHHYDGPPPPQDSPADPARDATTLPLIRAAIARGLPVLAICRGIQELNVALGGSLHQEVHAVPGRLDHRSDKTLPPHERYRDAHRIALAEGGVLQRLLDGASAIDVNSLHGQAIDRLAPGLAVEATAPDGTIEAVSLPHAPAFVLGVQWHPESGVPHNPVSRALFAAFGAASRAHVHQHAAADRPDGALAAGD